MKSDSQFYEIKSNVIRKDQFIFCIFSEQWDFWKKDILSLTLDRLVWDVYGFEYGNSFCNLNGVIWYIWATNDVETNKLSNSPIEFVCKQNVGN